MDEMVAWLRGVLDADETAAKAATPGPWGAQPGGQGTFDNEWEVVSDAHEHPHPGHYVVYTGYEGGGASSEQNALHIARHDPEQVLADIAAKRMILAGHTPLEWPTRAPAICPTCARWDWETAMGDDAATVVNYPCSTLRTLASAYRHRPGWKDEWA